MSISQTSDAYRCSLLPPGAAAGEGHGEPAMMKVAERIERVYHGGSALPLSDTTPRLIVEPQTVPTV